MADPKTDQPNPPAPAAPAAPEPTLAQDPDAALLKMGDLEIEPPAEEPTPSEPAKPGELKTVKIEGKEYQVTQEIAAAIEEREKNFKRRFSEQSDELGQLRRDTQPKPPEPPKTEPQEDSIEDQLFTNPKRALERLRTEIREEIRTEYYQEEGRKNFWTKFHVDNPDLVSAQRLSAVLLQEHWTELKDKTQPDARERLAELVREEIAKYAAPAGERTTPRTTVEGPSTPAPAKPAEAPKPKDTISDILRKRRDNRRARVATA